MHTWGLYTSESIKKWVLKQTEEPQQQALAKIQKDYRPVISPGALGEPCSSDVVKKEAAETHAEQSLGQAQGSYSISEGSFRLDVDPMQQLTTHPFFFFN